MQIRKKYRVESAHIVRNCSSQRCSHSIHGHSAVIEVFFKSEVSNETMSYDAFLDNAQMVVDFGLLSKVKAFIDTMDHCYMVNRNDNPEFVDFIKKSCDRYIELPFNPSAECLSMFIYMGVDRILRSTKFNNGEKRPIVTSVIYHETETGYAQCFEEDFAWWNNIPYSNYIQLSRVVFSEGCKKDALKQGLDLDVIMNKDNFKDKAFENPVIEKQIDNF